MKAQAVLYQRDRNKTYIPIKRGTKTFRARGGRYVIDPDAAVFATKRRFGRFGRQVTVAEYHYQEGIPKPLPLPNVYRVPVNKKDDPVLENNDLVVGSQELDDILDPALLRMLRATNTDKMNMMLLGMVALGGLLLYLVISGGMPT